METRTSQLSPCRLRVADASADSRASKMISLSTPFSLDTASTAIRISLFIANSCSGRPQPRLLYPLKRQAERLAVDLHHNRAVLDRLQYPDEAPASVHGQLQLREDP